MNPLAIRKNVDLKDLEKLGGVKVAHNLDLSLTNDEVLRLREIERRMEEQLTRATHAASKLRR